MQPKRNLTATLNAAYNQIMDQRDALLKQHDHNGPTSAKDQATVRELNSLLRDLWDHYDRLAQAPLYVRIWRAIWRAMPLKHIGG